MEPKFLALVTWEDALVENDYMHLEEVLNQKPCLIHTAGFLIQHNDDRLVICQDIDPDGQVRNTTFIPRQYVREFQSIPLETEDKNES